MRLPFFVDPGELYRRLASLGTPVLLDSGGDRGRFDIVAAAPRPELGLRIAADVDDRQLRRQLDDWLVDAQQRIAMGSRASSGDAPFRGGFIGHFSYELGRRLQGFSASQGATLPLAVVHYYPWAIVQDRQRKSSELVSDGTLSESATATIIDLIAAPSPPVALKNPASTFALSAPFARAWTAPAYARVFARVADYIRAGDCYQINIGQPFSAPWHGPLFDAYAALRAVAQAPYSAYFPMGEHGALLSLSPERFLTVDDRRVETRPIKGTRPRHANPACDRAAADELLASEKERAENLMIVDLLRNDIGRYCVPGSVKVDKLFSVESYATVHHLVSVVSGTLLPGTCALSLLLGCLPGGSITGAPKRRAMEIIDELESAPRQAWCGTIFYLSRHGRLDSNITIRTLYTADDQLQCWAGGGLVSDSQPGAEYQEQFDKVGAFLQKLEETLQLSG